MHPKTTDLTGLQARKQLLIVESELNRAQLVAEWREVKTGMVRLADQISTVGSMAESIAKISASISTLFRGFSRNNGDGQESSWISTLFKGARAGASWWSSFRSHSR